MTIVSVEIILKQSFDVTTCKKQENYFRCDFIFTPLLASDVAAAAAVEILDQIFKYFQ